MEYTPQEVAKLLANRPHQPHYVEWLLKQCIQRELAAERERCARLCEQQGAEWDSDAVQTLKNYAAHCATLIRQA